MKSTIDCIKYLVTEMDTDQSVTGRTISIDRLYTSIESANWLLYRGIATVAERESGIPSELFGTKNREICSATCHFVVLSTSKPLHGQTIDDGKGKPQIIKFYDFTKGKTDIVDQLNDYYTTRSKSCRWVMVALSYMLDTARVNGKTVWCLKNDSDISRTSSYNFS